MSDNIGELSFKAEGSWWKAFWIFEGDKPTLLAQIRVNMVPPGSENYHKFIDIVTAGVALGFQETSPDVDIKIGARVGGVLRQ